MLPEFTDIREVGSEGDRLYGKLGRYDVMWIFAAE